MAASKVGVREFRERIAMFLESERPVAVTRRGQTLGVYVSVPRRRSKSADISELKAAADRLAQILTDVDEKEIVSEFQDLRHKRRRRG
jgi:PHD/YefM family antitoxin component YafN of YafNO toxin-antitoxin module